jgi:hypothetical protein
MTGLRRRWNILTACHNQEYRSQTPKLAILEKISTHEPELKSAAAGGAIIEHDLLT